MNPNVNIQISRFSNTNHTVMGTLIIDWHNNTLIWQRVCVYILIYFSPTPYLHNSFNVRSSKCSMERSSVYNISSIIIHFSLKTELEDEVSYGDHFYISM